MKILIISRSYPPTYGPRSLQIWKVANALANGVNKVIIITQFSISSNEMKTDEKYIIPENPNLRVFYAPGIRDLRIHNKMHSRLLSKLNTQLNIINPKSTWIKGAVSLADNIIKSTNIDLVLSCSHPFDSHLVGLKIKDKFNLPWISFFSDPWPILPNEYQLKTQIMLLNKIKSIYFNKVINSCDAVATPTKYQSKYMEKVQKVNFSYKYYDLPHIGESPSHINPMYNNWLVHTGTLERGQVSLPLLRALKMFSINHHDSLEGLLLVGTVCNEFNTLAKKESLSNYIKHIGQVSHEEAINISAGAKLLLIIDWDMEESPILRAKLSDYAMTGRPILAVTSKRSAVRDYIEKYGGGVAVVHKEDEIYNALISLAIQSETGKEKNLLDTKKLAEQFSIDFISKKYLEVFNKVISIS